MTSEAAAAAPMRDPGDGAPELADPSALLAGLPAPALVVDQARILAANPAAARLLGTDGLAGRWIADILPLAWMKISAADGGQDRTETSLFDPDGSERRVEVTSLGWPTSAAPQRRLILLHDVTEWRRREDTLHRRHARLRRLTARRDSRQRADSLRAARDLHDRLQQPLAAMLYELAAVGSRLEQLAPLEATAVRRVGEIAATALASTAAVIEALRPLLPEELGVLDATEALARRFMHRTGVHCRVRARGFQVEPPPGVIASSAYLLHDAVSEALDNVVRYARATRVRIALVRAADGRLRMRIRDDGIGFGHVALDPSSFGLHGLLERIAAVGGDFVIGAARPRGTRIDIHLPGDPAQAPAPVIDDALPPEHSYEGLLRFLYRVPVGLVEADAHGVIRLMNPAAARMLMPLAPTGGLANLFDVLDDVLPELRARAQRSGDRPGIVCPDIAIAAAGELPGPLSRVELSVHRLAPGQLMAMLVSHPPRSAQESGPEESPPL
jgi:signal transduction histidine kinase